MQKAGDGSSQSHSTQHKALSKSPPSPNNAPQTVLTSRSGDIVFGSVDMPNNKDESTYPESPLGVTPRTLQKVPSYADFTKMALSRSDSQGATGANPTVPSNQPSGSRHPRLPGNLTTAGPLAGSSSGPRITKHKDTSQFETAPKARSQRDDQLHSSTDDAQGVSVQPISSSKSSGTSTSMEGRTQPRNVPSSRAPQKTSGDAPFGLPRAEEPAEGNQSPLPKADLSREGSTMKPLAQEVDRIASVHPPHKPFTHSTPALNQPSASVSPSPSGPAPAITTTGSSWMRPAHRDDRGGIATRPPDEDKRQVYPNEPSSTRATASSRDPPFPPEHVASEVDVDSLSLPRSLDRSSPHLQGNEGVEREAKRAAETLTSDKKGGKRATASKEPEIHQEDPTTDPYSAHRRKLESSPPSSHAPPDIKPHLKAPPQSSVELTSQSSVSREYGPGATHLPASGEFGINTGRSDAISSLRTTEASVTPHVPLPIQNQVKHAGSTPSNNKPTGSITYAPPRPPTVVGDSQIYASPFLSRSTSSLVGAPITSITSREAGREGETHPGIIPPSKPGDDTSSKLPDYHHHMETRNPSLVQVDSPHEEVENKTHAKPSDSAQPAYTAPSIIKASPNTGKERVSQTQPGHSILQPQHSQSESSRILPNQQHRTNPTITRETGLPSSEHAVAIGAPSFPHFRPVIAYLPVEPDEIHNPERSPPLPPYEPGPLGAPVAQEGTLSRSGARIPGEARDEPKKLPASLVLEAPHHSDNQGHMDRPEELKRLLLPTRDDAVAAVCPPPDHSQSVEVYRGDRSHSPHGVRQREALSSPKIWDRSRSGSSVEQDIEAIMIPLAPQKRRDPPITDIQQEAGSHDETGSFDDEDWGRRLRVRSDEDGRPGQKDNHARESQVLPHRVPQVEVIPPTPRTSLARTTPQSAPSDIPPVPTPPAPTPPAPTPPAPTPPAPTSSPGPPASSPRRKKGILGRICPCLG